MMLTDNIFINNKRAVNRSYAKINLTLDVLSKRADGYHEIKTIMQTVNLFDLIITDRTRSGIKVSTNLKYLPTNEKNTAYKAAKLFFGETEISGGANILIHKNIPVCAGLAGGSGNGAAVLAALNALYGNPLDDKTLMKLALRIGADVPFCLTGGTALSEGIGEIITPIYGMKCTDILLVKPDINVSTAAIYDAIDSVSVNSSPDTNEMIQNIKIYNIDGIAAGLCNVMEEVTIPMHKEIKKIKEQMYMHGAAGALMSGSGPTVFGVFSDSAKAKKAADAFAKKYKDVYLCKTINQM